MTGWLGGIRRPAAGRLRFPLTALLLYSFLGWPAFSQTFSLTEVLQRSREAVARYGEEAAVLLADEKCEQKALASRVELGGGGFGYGGAFLQRIDPKGQRSWQAEIALVRTEEMAGAGYPWMEFRDVVKVDGRALPDREARLSRLFLQQPEWTLEKARAIGEESARFNIGSVRRNVNTPAVPLLFLHPANEGRFSLTKTGEEVIDRTRVWKVDYQEKTRPGLVAGGDRAADCAAQGTFWIDPATGEVLRASFACGDPQETLSRMTVTYRRNERLGLRLPVEMAERPESDSGKAWVEGKCSYSNFRRFETGARLIVPK